MTYHAKLTGYSDAHFLGSQTGPHGPSRNSSLTLAQAPASSYPRTTWSQFTRAPQVKLPSLSVAYESHTLWVHESHPQYVAVGVGGWVGARVGRSHFLGSQTGPQGPSRNSSLTFAQAPGSSYPRAVWRKFTRDPHVKLPSVSVAKLSHTSWVQESHPHNAAILLLTTENKARVDKSNFMLIIICFDLWRCSVILSKLIIPP